MALGRCRTRYGGRLAALGDEYHRTALCIGGNRDVLAPPSAGGLVDRQFARLGTIRLRQRQFNIPFGNRIHPPPTLRATAANSICLYRQSARALKSRVDPLSFPAHGG